MRVRYNRRALAQLSDILEALGQDAPDVAASFSRRVETLAGQTGR